MSEILKTKLSSARIERAKRELKKALPEVKSSYRIEAFARGMGFKTYASLLKHVQDAEAGGQSDVIAYSYDGPFNAYFKNSDVTLPTATTLSDMVRKWPEAGQ